MAEISRAWGAAYAEWLAARAEMAKRNADVDQPELPEDQEDALTDKMIDRLNEAERDLIRIPVELGWQVLQKFEVLHAMLIEVETAGTPADGRHLLMAQSFYTGPDRLP